MAVARICRAGDWIFWTRAKGADVPFRFYSR